MPDTALRALQSWMEAVIRNPGGAEVGVESASAREMDAEEVVRSTGALSAVERLQLYNRGYHARLLECLATAYPALRQTMGRELFEAFVLDYVDDRPSRSYTLHGLTDGFADHLEATRPDRDAPEQWVDLLVELARLEQAFAQVFDGPGSEGEEAPAPGDLPELPDARCLERTVEVAPAFRLLPARFDLSKYFLAARLGESAPLPAAADGAIVLTRKDYVVLSTQLGLAQRLVLEALMEGATIGTAAAAHGVQPVEVWGWVRSWAARVFFRRVDGDPADGG